MTTTIVAFDVDGTLIQNVNPDTRVHGKPDNDDVPNVEIINMLMLFSRFKNVKIVVWSGGGKQYAETWGRRLGLDKYVWRYAAKTEAPDMPHPIIAIDDVHACNLGIANLIVHQKGEWHGNK